MEEMYLKGVSHWFIKTLPKAQRTRGLSSDYQSKLFRSYHKFSNKSWSDFIFKILTEHSFRISTKNNLHNSNQGSAAKYWLNFSFKIFCQNLIRKVWTKGWKALERHRQVLLLRLRLSASIWPREQEPPVWSSRKSLGSYRTLAPISLWMAGLRSISEWSEFLLLKKWQASAEKWSPYVWKPGRQQSPWKYSNCLGFLGLAVQDSNVSFGSVTSPTLPVSLFWFMK